MDPRAGGYWLINKPAGWTSFDVVNKLRHALRKKTSQRMKVGHAGTLDPFATGLLIVCYGSATKQIQELVALEKTYTGTMYLGATTPTYDADSPVNGTFPVEHLHEAILHETSKKFIGEILQTPPAFSAVKVNGQRAYNLARAGKEVELAPRKVVVYDFQLTRIALPEVDFRVTCSKGFYVRSLAYDFGRAVQSGAYLMRLCRTRIGAFMLENALTVEECIEQINRSEM
ncbi:MAG: tRNA pseudouridine(55) synthase TruB [Chitinophagales bacterium]|nr:tRNA pseudouridine(55) synthase TruB [Chitinophagales bacterium]MDW8419399.1 tRNA pseudouridine(55) synthase TruB [Chitinophagales bacterium]